jgi:hypothetical protein
VLFLASNDRAFVTGTELFFDGEMGQAYACSGTAAWLNRPGPVAD